MNKLKVLSGVLSLAVLSTMSVANADSIVVGKLIASPSAMVAEQVVGTQVTAYIEGDKIVTGSEASASISLSSGNAKITVAPNTVMAVTDASNVELSLTQGAFAIQAKEGQVVTVETSKGSFDLTSSVSVDAIAAFQNGEFSAISKNGLLTVASQDGAVTSIDAGNAFVYNGNGAASLDVQAAGSTSSAVNTALIIGGIIVGTVVVGEEISDGDDAQAASVAN